ncbi:MAG TPA: HDOD domain-containing protein [Acidobacteriaceae bacterium]|nr:HDOD domain-containing protein [Acidobacteriaceae bacterium]
MIAPLQLDAPETAADQRARLLAPSRFLGRQPIVDAHCGLFGYELLLRPERMTRVSDDPEQIACETVDHWLLLTPDDGQGAAFVHCTRALIVDGFVTLLPAENTVLVLDASPDLGLSSSDPELLTVCLELQQRGYRFSLDYARSLPTGSPLLEIADFIRIDFSTTDFPSRRELYCRAEGRHRRFLAEEIETEVQMRIALAEGCSLFQGNFVCQPILFSSRSVPQNSTVYLTLLALLQRMPTDLRKVEKLISGDPSLCFRVLRLANSALQGHPGIVASIQEALLLVGDNAVRRLVTVAMAGALAAHRSPAVLSMALARARFCELLAPSLAEPPGPLYLLGILSLLDVLLECPLDRILRSLPLSPEMKSALAGDASPAGRTLALVRALEACDWQHCEELQHDLGLGEGSVASSYVEAIRWAALMIGNELPG